MYVHAYMYVICVHELILFSISGEGQYLHIHNLNSGNRLATHKVFEAAVVHGIKIRPVKNEESRNWVVGVWGQKSLAVLLYKCLPGNKM